MRACAALAMAEHRLSITSVVSEGDAGARLDAHGAAAGDGARDALRGAPAGAQRRRDGGLGAPVVEQRGNSRRGGEEFVAASLRVRRTSLQTRASAAVLDVNP